MDQFPAKEIEAQGRKYMAQRKKGEGGKIEVKASVKNFNKEAKDKMKGGY